MITSPRTSVTPQQALARLTLATSAAEEKIRRKSTIGSGGRPSLGHIDGLPLIGPAGPPLDSPIDVFDGESLQSPTKLDYSGTDELHNAFAVTGIYSQRGIAPSPEGNGNSQINDVDMQMNGDNSSEVTLVSATSVEDSVMLDATSQEQQQQVLEDKENLAPTKEEEHLERPPSPEKPAPLVETSPSKLNAQAGMNSTTVSTLKPNPEEKRITEPTNRPPPIPPRPAQQNNIPTLEEYARQQDVTEVLAHSLFQLSCAIKPTAVDKDGNQEDQVQDLFFGRNRTHLLPDDPSHNAEDKFLSIIVRLVSFPHDIYAALDSYFDVDEVEGGSRRYTSISNLPPVFQIHLDRVGYDPISKTACKLNHHVELKETIYLDRYMEADVDSLLMERRQQTWTWKKQLAEIDARRKELTANQNRPDVVSTFDNARQILMDLQQFTPSEDVEDIAVSPATITTLEALADQTRAELNDLDTRARDVFQKADTNFTDLRKQAYRLHAAFFHRGTGMSGHYWIYIYDFKKEIWRKYNDGYVTEIKDTNEIFRAPAEAEVNTWSGPPNPYFLVYVRDSIKDKLVESVHRQIILPPRQPTPPADVNMVDGSGTETAQHFTSTVSWPSQSQPDTTIPIDGALDLSGADVKTKW